jgi:hypothetical protein
MVNPETLAAAGINLAVRPEGNAGYLTGNAFGFQIQEVPLFREDLELPGTGGDAGTELWLTNAQNLLWGIKREVTIHREFKPKKDTIEYTVYVRQGVQVQHADAAVVVTNLGPAASTLLDSAP